MLFKRTALMIIPGIILAVILFGFTQGQIFNKNSYNQKLNNSMQIKKLAAQMTKNPDIMIKLMNKLDKINNDGAKRVTAICDSLTGLKDDHYMILKMFYGDNQ